MTGGHETSDGYGGIVVQLSRRWRVVLCRDGIQWIVQHRKSGGAERPWRGLGYFAIREGLIRFCTRLKEPIDQAALARLSRLPERATKSRSVIYED